MLTSLTVNGASPIHRDNGGGFDPYFGNYVMNMTGPVADLQLAWGLDDDAVITSLRVVNFRDSTGVVHSGSTYLTNVYDLAEEIPARDLCANPDADYVCSDPTVLAAISIWVSSGGESFFYNIYLAWPNNQNQFFSVNFYPGAMSGVAPEPISVLGPQFVRMPDAGGLYLENSNRLAFAWQAADQSLSYFGGYKFISTSEDLYAFHLLSEVVAPSNFQLNIESMSVSTLRPGQDAFTHLEINTYGYPATHFEFEAIVRNTVNTWYPPNFGHYRLELSSWPDGEVLDVVDSRSTSRNIVSTGSDCASLQSSECTNAFKLKIEVVSANLSSSVEKEYFLLRQTDFSDPQVSVVWAQNETEITQLDYQDWFALPEVDDPYVEAIAPAGTVFAGFSFTQGGPIAFKAGSFAPILSNTTFYPVWVSKTLPTSLEIFGHHFQLAPCALDATETCLILLNEGAPAQEYESSLSDADGYFVTLDLSEEFLLNDPTDDHLQDIVLAYPSGTSSTATLGSVDHRIDGYSEFAISITGGSKAFEDSELCTNWGCHEALYVLLTSESAAQDWTGIVAFVLDFHPDQTYAVEYVDQDYNSLTPQPVSVQQPLARGWLDFAPEAEPNIAGYSFNGWSTFSSSTRYLRSLMFPVLQDETIFPWLRYDIRVWSEGNQIDTITTDTSMFPNQLTTPTSSTGDAFLGWALTDGGTPIANPDTYTITGPGPVDVFAVFQDPSEPTPPVNPTPPNNQPPVQGDSEPFVAPVAPPAASPPVNSPVEAEIDLSPISTKTMTIVSFENGITTVESVIPAKYVNRPAFIEIRRVINGKVRFYRIGKAWTHYDRKRNDFSKAAMTFRFPLELKPNDIIRVKVRGVQVARATGDGKPAWR